MPVRITDYYRYLFFRLIFGSYIFSVFIYFAFFSVEIFSSAGAKVSSPNYFPFLLFPNLLSFLNQPFEFFTFYFFGGLLAILFICDLYKSIVCVLLWYIWACTFNQFNFIISPGCVTVGWLILLNSAIPKAKNEKNWQIPKLAIIAAWVFMFFLYVPSGIHKLFSPSWIEGKAIYHMMNFPMAKLNEYRQWILDNAAFAKLANDFAIYAEILFGFFIFTRRLRSIGWLLTLILHIGILSVIHFEFLTFGVLMAHIFTFDWKWIQREQQI